MLPISQEGQRVNSLRPLDCCDPLPGLTGGLLPPTSANALDISAVSVVGMDHAANACPFLAFFADTVLTENWAELLIAAGAEKCWKPNMASLS